MTRGNSHSRCSNFLHKFRDIHLQQKNRHIALYIQHLQSHNCPALRCNATTGTEASGCRSTMQGISPQGMRLQAGIFFFRLEGVLNMKTE